MISSCTVTRSVRARTCAMATFAVLTFPLGSAAQERLCDTQFEDCRAPLLELIRNETRGIDVAFWFMEDARYVSELIRRHSAGVPVRVLVDQRANASKRLNETILQMLRDGGIPMREKYTGDVLHFKMMLFDGQDVVQFSKANYTSPAFVPIQPNVNYDDEAVFFTDDGDLTNTFRRRFDDLWVDADRYRNFANVTQAPSRSYPVFPIHPAMNFPPLQDFANRAASRYDAEPQGIDAIAFRVTDARHSNAMIRAVSRGAAVRLITEPGEYRNLVRRWHAKHIDRMHAAGVRIKHRQHAGMTHEAAVVMHGLGEVIFGSSNWTESSAAAQDEHNYFYSPALGKPWFFWWFADQFERKWNDGLNYVPFRPLPPDTPVYSSPLNLAAGVSSSASLTWDGGPWAHLYDVYFGDSASPLLRIRDQELGSPDDGIRESYTVSNLLPGTTYYWRIVGKTWAGLEVSGPTWSFTTAGSPSGGGSTPLPMPYAGTAAAIPGLLQAEDFDTGGQHVAHFDATAINSGGAYRVTEVDLQATTDAGGGYNLGWTRTGEWLTYSVNVATTGTYTLETRVAVVGAGASFSVEVDGVAVTGPIAVPDTGGWQTWRTVVSPGIALTAGRRIVRVSFGSVSSAGAAGNYNWFRFVDASTPLPPSPAYGGVPVLLPGILQAENFDVGGQGVAYFDTSAGNTGAVYRSTDVDLGANTDPSSGGFHLGWARAGEWTRYTVDVAESRTYTLHVRLANVGSGAAFRVEIDGAPWTGAIAVPDTGGWDVWRTVSIGGLPLTRGGHVVRLVMMSRNVENSSVGNFGYLRFD